MKEMLEKCLKQTKAYLENWTQEEADHQASINAHMRMRDEATVRKCLLQDAVNGIEQALKYESLKEAQNGIVTAD